MRAELQTGFVVLEDLMLLKLWTSSRLGNACRCVLDFRFLARFRKDTCGGVLIYFAFMLPVLLGVSGLAVDASLWYGHKRDLQATADVAALTAALEMTRLDDETLGKTAAKADAITNGFDEAEGDTLEINTPPTSGPFAGQNGVFEAIVTRPVPTFLARLVYPDQVIVAARAVASVAGSSVPCVLALEENEKNAIKVNNGSFFADGCKVQINSSNQQKALQVYSGATMDADEINIVGEYVNKGYISSEPNTGMSAFGDPLAGLSPPPISGCDYNDVAFDEGIHVLSPGVYCGGLSLSGTADVELEPGTYIIQNGDFSTSGGELQGEDVTFYMAGDSSVSMTGQSDIELSAPLTGDYTGVLFYGDPNASTTVQHHINGNSNMAYNGFMYFPTAELMYNGNGMGTTSNYTAVIARLLRFGGNGELHFNYDPDIGEVPELPGGSTVTLVE